MVRRWQRLIAAVLALAAPAGARGPAVSEQWLRAHEQFLAGDALAGRGSATHDEAIAAAYVAAQFRAFGLQPAPGREGYLQEAPIVRRRETGPATLSVDGAPVAGLTVLRGEGGVAGGRAVIVADAKALPTHAEVLVFTGPALDGLRGMRGLAAMGARLVLVADEPAARALAVGAGGTARLPVHLADQPARPTPTIALLPATALAAIRAGADVQAFTPFAEERTVTTNAIGFLPGTDPAAPLLLLTAHLDHLGVEPDGTVMHGANDDAAGTTAVLELARVLAAGPRLKRGILFVAYGSEEIGEFGSTWFGKHPPVPLTRIAANLEFEMVGAQDPKFPRGALMMTGAERSTLFDVLKAHGAAVQPDPYADQHFFERSDNYALALTGVVAHTLAGWSVPPSYHQPTDTIANLDFAYMTHAIGSLVAPIRAIANSAAAPHWKPNGQPHGE